MGDGFDQLFSMLPNFTSNNSSDRSELTACVPPRNASEADNMSSSQRRQHKNKVAQKRFRERAKVRVDSSLLLSHTTEAKLICLNFRLGHKTLRLNLQPAQWSCKSLNPSRRRWNPATCCLRKWSNSASNSRNLFLQHLLRTRHVNIVTSKLC